LIITRKILFYQYFSGPLNEIVQVMTGCQK